MILKNEGEELVSKILNEEKMLQRLYPEKSVLDDLREKQEEVENLKAEAILKNSFTKNKIELALEFLELVPLHFDDNQNWWKWDAINYYWKMIDETEILILICKATDLNVVNSKERQEILTAIKIKARERKPKEMKKTWIQFDRIIVDIETGDQFSASPQYFITNPIPFKLGKDSETPYFDKLFKEWVNDNNVNNLYEILAYSLLPDYPIERILCLLGGGSNGKSTYIKILYTFIGLKNICTTSLEALSNSRFETTKLYKKLVCIMSETNFSTINNSNKIKALASGKDPVSLEFKNKSLGDFINYAKIIIATNNLPPTDDKTDGFYRRWMIIEFPNQFEKEVDILKDIPLIEYENLARKCLTILSDLLKRRSFTNEGSIHDRKKKYEEKSNPFDKFWDEYIIDNNAQSDIPVWEFNKELNDYMKNNNVRQLSDKMIASMIKEKGIEQIRKRVEWYENEEAKVKMVRSWAGISWKK